jgi:hypothetical protein
VSILVLPPYVLDQHIPSSVSSEHMLDKWLEEKVRQQPHMQVGSDGAYTLFLMSVEEMLKASEGGRRGHDRIVMGLHRHGWVSVPGSALENETKLKSR